MPSVLRSDRIALGLILGVFVAALSVAADDPKMDVSAKGPVVPADLENWTIEFDGIEDQPRRPLQFHISLAQDGTTLVETWRGMEERRKSFDGKLTAKETRRFFDRAVKVINEYDKEKSDGNRADSWNLSLAIAAKTYTRKVKFWNQKEVSDRCAPGFSDIVEIIRGKLYNGEFFPDRSNK